MNSSYARVSPLLIEYAPLYDGEPGCDGSPIRRHRGGKAIHYRITTYLYLYQRGD